MNNDLISRSALIKELKQKCAGNCKKCEYSTFLSSDEHCGVIDELPAVEAKEVVRGEWMPQYFDSYCSVCGYVNKAEFMTRLRSDHNFCPNCGADMRK